MAERRNVDQQDQSVRMFSIRESKDGSASPASSVTHGAIEANERRDVQRLIKRSLDIVGEDPKIAAEELARWTEEAETLERADVPYH